MEKVKKSIAGIDWQEVASALHNRGFACIPKILPDDLCAGLIRDYDLADLYRKKVVMERHRFGLGEYKYYNYPLPLLVQCIRESLYPRLAPIANNWMQWLGIPTVYPDSLSGFLQQCWEKAQVKATPLILKYGKNGFNNMHQDLYGEMYFPLQAVLFLNQPGQDYIGGEFVVTQQTPRAQSSATVLSPDKGDLLVFTTNFRPVKGTRGYYRVNMKHGVSRIQEGERHTLGILFHDALT